MPEVTHAAVELVAVDDLAAVDQLVVEDDLVAADDLLAADETWLPSLIQTVEHGQSFTPAMQAVHLV